MERIRAVVEHNIESLVRSRDLVDNSELIKQAWYRTTHDLDLDDWTFRRGTTLVRQVVRSMCHQGTLVIFYKYTKDEAVSLIVCHHQRLQSVLERITRSILSMKDGVTAKQVRSSDRRILDILVYMGEADLIDETVVSVVKALEDRHR